MPTDFECQLAAASIPLSHAWEHTVGSGRALLALRADWREQLRRAHFDLGLRHVRFHGMLDDDIRRCSATAAMSRRPEITGNGAR